MNKPKVRLAILATCIFLPVACKTSAPDKPVPHEPRAAPAAQEQPMATDSKTVHPSVVARFCGQPPGPAPLIVKVLKDSAGNIGGYTHTMQIMDSPIFYLDKEGKEYAMFHIFGSDAEKAKNTPLIDKLRAAYPVEAPLICP